MNLFEVTFLLLMLAVLSYGIFNTVRRGGFREANFNAKITETVGEISTTKATLAGKRVMLFLLERDSQQLVGIEVTEKSILNYEKYSMVLSRPQALELARLLQRAAESK